MADTGPTGRGRRPRRLLGLFFALMLPTTATAAAPRFVDVTVEAGVDYLQHSVLQPPDCVFGDFCEPDRMTGGAAVGDIDSDGDLDLFVTRLYAHDLLFCNRLVETGVARFENCTRGSGLRDFVLQSNGAGFVDVDNDGDLDLFVGTLAAASDTANDRNLLFINDGSGRFSEEAAQRGADAPSGTRRRIFGLTFGDFDRDGWVDLYTTEWAPRFGSNSRLLRNLGPDAPGHFEDVTDAAGVSLDGVHAFAPAFTDLDGDGWLDLAVAADFGGSRLFWNNRDGSFSDGTTAAKVATDENGMGSTFGDFDGDGDLDWFVTSIFDPDQTCEIEGCNWGYSGNRLYRNEGGRVFSDATDEAGVRDGSWGWGAGFLDYDNDGDLDLAMTNGIDFPTTVDDAFRTDPARLWENDGSGVMSEVAAERGLVDTRSGKGLLVFDYDQDGDLDLLMVNNGAGPALFRNDGGNAKDWLRVRIAGAPGEAEGLGVRVTLRVSDESSAQLREIGTGTHFLAQSERVAHFGLGDGSDPVYEVTVRWPDGRTRRLRQVDRNQTLVLPAPAASSLASLGAACITLAALRLRRVD